MPSLENLPGAIAGPGHPALFSYGSLQIKKILQSALATPGGRKPRVHTATSIADAAQFQVHHPDVLVILPGFQLAGVRAGFISSETINLYLGNNLAAVNKEVKKITGERRMPPSPPEVYLHVRKTPVKETEWNNTAENRKNRPRYVNGSLILGLTDEQFRRLDAFEVDIRQLHGKPFDGGAFRRVSVEELKMIKKGKMRTFRPRHIEFYEGNISEKILRRTRLRMYHLVLCGTHGAPRKKGKKASGAKWPDAVRGRGH